MPQVKGGMLGLTTRSSHRQEEQNLIPVQHARMLLSTHDATLARIHSMVGVPAKHWRALYEPLFSAYAEYVQQLPGSSTCVRSGTMLRHALQAVELALKVRRGYVLPPGKEPEAVANEQDIWTYAVVIVALLTNAGEALLEQRVMLHDRVRRPMTIWTPWTGPLSRSGAAFYRVDLCRDVTNGLAKLGLPLLLGHVVPVDGLRWLAAHEDALVACLRGLGGSATGVSVIRDIVTRALHPSGANSGSETPETLLQDDLDADSAADAPPGIDMEQELSIATVEPVAEGESRNTNCLETDVAHRQRAAATGDGQNEDIEAFLEWLRNGISSGVLTVNMPKGHLHVVEAGLLLASPAVFRAFAGDKWREVQKRFLKRKLTERTPKGENIFHYRRHGDPARATIKGVLIRHPQQTLGVSLPPADPRLVPKQG